MKSDENYISFQFVNKLLKFIYPSVSMFRFMFLPHWGRDNMTAMLQTTSNAFYSMKIFEFLLNVVEVCWRVSNWQRGFGSWWRHQMGTLSALLAICAGNSPVPGEFPAQRPVTRSFDVFFDLRLNKWLSKQSWGWWFEALSCPLWRHCKKLDAEQATGRRYLNQW